MNDTVLSPEASIDEPAGNWNRDAIMRIPVKLQVVFGSASMPVSQLMKLGRGGVVTLDRKVGDPVDVVVNGRVVARGDIVVVDEATSRLGVTLTEIVGSRPEGSGGES
ncbi:MAG: fliN [Hyphomicrobiales bacterium]|jgi:flagellar motor switch protein FliN/FliY|nr:fliN [Hyphomicrobiales bacterium]